MQDVNGACMGLVRKFSFGKRASQGRGCFDSTMQNRTPFNYSITGSVMRSDQRYYAASMAGGLKHRNRGSGGTGLIFLT